MRRKEALLAVIGGVVGAVLVMAAGSFSPLGAQDNVKDAKFGTITCREVFVVDSNGRRLAAVASNRNGGAIAVVNNDGRRGAVIRCDANGGFIGVSNNKGSQRVVMDIGTGGGSIRVINNDNESCAVMRSMIGGDDGYLGGDGGYIGVYGKEGLAMLGMNHYGAVEVSVFNKDGFRCAEMTADERGGSIDLYDGKGGGQKAGMGVNEYGNGAVSTWDKNGDRLATLK